MEQPRVSREFEITDGVDLDTHPQKGKTISNSNLCFLSLMNIGPQLN
jgi:hypothetical protein